MPPRVRLALLVLAGACLGPGSTGEAAAAQTSDIRLRLLVAPASFELERRLLWQGAGVMIGDATAFGADRAAVLARNDFRWIALKIHHGLGRVRQAEALLRSEWPAAFRAEGIRICGWGALDGRPVSEARLVATLIRRFALDCYIADAEDPYMGGAYGGVVGRSSAFVGAFRARLGALPAAVTTYGAALYPWILPFDYGAWSARGFALLPQAYLSIAAHYGPKSVTAHAIRAGFSRASVHPMIGIGWTQGRRKHWGGDYVWRLVAARTKGFSVFLGETTSDTDFDVLGRGIARFAIAR